MTADIVWHNSARSDIGTYSSMKQVIAQTLEALRANPGLLAVVLINLLFLSVILVAVREERSTLSKQMTLILERCLPQR